MSLDSLAAAKKLAGTGHVRSSVSRSYYAAYSAVTVQLTSRGASFPRGWKNPPHEQLLSLIRHNLPLKRQTRGRLRSLMRFLRKSREDADYRPERPLGSQTGLELHSIRRCHNEELRGERR